MADSFARVRASAHAFTVSPRLTRIQETKVLSAAVAGLIPLVLWRLGELVHRTTVKALRPPVEA
jgi:hypothetical protein